LLFALGAHPWRRAIFCQETGRQEEFDRFGDGGNVVVGDPEGQVKLGAGEDRLGACEAGDGLCLDVRGRRGPNDDSLNLLRTEGHPNQVTGADFSYQLRRQVVVECLKPGCAAAALMYRTGSAVWRRGQAFICDFNPAKFKIRRGRFFLSEGPSDWNVDDHLDEFIFFPRCRQVGCDSLTCSVGHASFVR